MPRGDAARVVHEGVVEELGGRLIGLPPLPARLGLDEQVLREEALLEGEVLGYYEFDQRFEHPGRTWASATHRAFSFACVGAAMANETWKFVLAKSKQAMKQVLGIKDEAARMKVTPPLAVAPLAHGDDMRWNPNDDGINFNP